jgi:DNA topoisomerase I
VLSIGLNRAIDLLANARPAKAKGKNLGIHPDDGKPVLLRAGRYGTYVEHGRVRATLPTGIDAESLDLDRAAALLADKAERTASKGKSKSSRAEATAGQRIGPRAATASARARTRKQATKSSARS